MTQKMSMMQIAEEFGGTKSQVERLMKLYHIPVRSHSEAKRNCDRQEFEDRKVDEVEQLKSKISMFTPKVEFVPVTKKNMLIPVPLDNKARDATLTLVISDLHIGDSNHLPETYWSTVSNVLEVIKNIQGFYKIKKFNLVLNGDITNGIEVYRNQEFNNLVQRPHWQVFATEMIIKDTMRKLSELVNTNEIVLVRGTHDNMANNLVMYLKRLLPGRVVYLSQGGIYNLGDDGVPYNILFMHGYGWSNSNPITSKMFIDVNAIMEMNRARGVFIERVCTSHTHWLSSGLIMGSLYWDTTGGFQKWDGTINQRPCGFILYLYSDGEAVSIPIRPDLNVEMKEKADPGLNYRNYSYYGNILLKHLKDVEGIE